MDDRMHLSWIPDFACVCTALCTLTAVDQTQKTPSSRCVVCDHSSRLIGLHLDLFLDRLPLYKCRNGGSQSLHALVDCLPASKRNQSRASIFEVPHTIQQQQS